jgi:hypothetical protein
MIIEISARNPHGRRDVGEGGMLVALPVEQLIGSLDDLIAGCPATHEITVP